MFFYSFALALGKIRIGLKDNPLVIGLVYSALYIKRSELILFSHAEVGEDVVEGFLGSDGAAGDVGERGEGEA